MTTERFTVQPGHLLAVFNSTHRVMKAESILKERNMEILLIPAPRRLRTECGLAIRFAGEAEQDVMAVLREGDVLPLFVSRFDGKEFETVWERE